MIFVQIKFSEKIICILVASKTARPHPRPRSPWSVPAVEDQVAVIAAPGQMFALIPHCHCAALHSALDAPGLSLGVAGNLDKHRMAFMTPRWSART